MAIEKVKHTRLNEQSWPLIDLRHGKRRHTWHMYLPDAVVARQQV
jgi:hypothetical protein